MLAILCRTRNITNVLGLLSLAGEAGDANIDNVVVHELVKSCQ